MSPTGVDLKVVSDRLALVEAALADLRALPNETLDRFTADRRNVPAAESHLRRALEALFDTARHLLAKGHGIGKLEYREIARLCGEKHLIDDATLVERFTRMGGFRNRYGEVTPAELYGVVRNHLADVESVAAELAEAATKIARA